MNKFERWYAELMVKAAGRAIPLCYTEIHHIIPRSLGGGDGGDNQVRLTYREHFLAHWLLTKFLAGGNLRKMQRALWAMTLKISGERIVSGWQFEAAKRAIRDLEMDPEAERLWYERWQLSRADYVPGGWRKPRDRKPKQRKSKRYRDSLKFTVQATLPQTVGHTP